MRTTRRLLVVLAIVLVILAVAVALLPRLVGAGLGHGLIKGRLDAVVSGDTDFDGIRASWTGVQHVEGLVLTADDGLTRVDVDVVVRHGLLDLLRGVPGVIEASVAGSARGRIDESGRPSFLRLPAAASAEGGGDGDGDGSGGADGDDRERRLPFGLRLDVDGLALDLDVAAPGGDRALRLSRVEGTVAIVPGAPVDVQLASPTEFDGTDGLVRVALAARDVVAADGRLTPLRATIDGMRLEVSGVPLPTGDTPAFLENLLMTAEGTPAGRLVASLEASARVGDAAEASRLEADAQFDRLVRDGEFDLDGAQWSITADGSDVPTAPFEVLLPGLADAGVDLSTDVGGTVQLVLAAGSAPGAAFTAELRGAAATLVATGTTAAGNRIDVAGVTLEATVRPELVARHTPMTLEGAIPFRVVAEPFVLDPAALVAGELPSATVTATSRGSGPFTMRTVAAGGAAAGRAGADAAPTEIRFAGFEAVLRPAAPAGAPGSGGTADAPPILRSGTLTLRDVAVRHPAVTGPVATPTLVLGASQRFAVDGAGAGTLSVDLSPAELTAGGTTLATLSGRTTLDLGGRAAGREPGDETDVAGPTFPAATLRLEGLDPTALERALDLSRNAIDGLTRGPGDVVVSIDPGRDLVAGARLDFPGTSGDLRARRTGELIDIELVDVVLRPSPERLARLTAGRGGGDPDRPALELDGDATITASGRVAGLSLDRLAAEGSSPLDAWASLSLDATTTPLTLVAGGTPSSLPPLALAVRTQRGRPLSVGIAARDAATSAGDDAAAPAAPSVTLADIAADLRVAGLDQAGGFDPARLAIDGEVRLQGASSALLDLLFGTGDLIASSIGERVDATLTADEFGPDAGRVVLAAAGTRGRVDATVHGRNGAFVVREDAPLVARLDLHPVLRRNVLSKIQPLFAGVSSTDGPITLTVTSALVPLSDGADAATAEFRTDGGTLFMEPGFDFLSLVSLFDGAGAGPRGQPLEARLEPVSGRLVAGRIVTDGTRLVFTKGASIDFAPGSSIDLENRTIDFRASMPLQWLGSVVREARAVTESLSVPLVARGSLDGAKLQVDPSFDLAGALLEAGVGSLLERELDRAVPGLGDLLRGLGGRRGG